MSLIVYTAITADYDVLSDPPEETRAGAKFIAFMETPSASQCWEIRPLELNHNDPKRRSIFYKMLPHRVFPDAQFSLWIDGSVDLIMPFSVTNLLDYLRDADLATFEHSSRYCIYQEAVECIRRRHDDPRRIYQQVRRYTQLGYPANMGLVEGGILLRRHSRQIEEFNEAWWEEFQSGSNRDQLSFNYVAHKLGLKFNVFPNSIRNNSLVRVRMHGNAE